MLKKFEVIVAIFFVLSISISSNAYAKRAVVKEFNYVTKMNREQPTNSCWADAIEMLVNTHGVNWNQDDVIKVTKGAINLKSVQVSEVSSFLNNWVFDYDGKKWSSSSRYYDGALSEKSLRNEIDNGRPIIVSTNGSHVLIVYGYFTMDKSIDSISYFDPHELRARNIDAKAFKQHTLHSWTFNITN
jgi:hypothetical protein